MIQTIFKSRETESMNTRDRLNVKISGQGARTIVFAHGYGCDQNMWRLVAPSFEANYRVVLFDFVGAGGSDDSQYSSHRYSSLEAYADDVLAIARELNLQDAIFVGHSVSAMIGILAGIEDPKRFSEMILVGPSPCYINEPGYVGGFERADIEGLLESLASNYLGWSNAMAPVIMGNPERPELAEELTNSFCRMDPEIARNFARITFLSDSRDDLRKVTARTLILQCSDDVIAPLVVGEYVHAQIAGSELVVMEATGHCPNLSAPAETTRAIKRFLGADGG